MSGGMHYEPADIFLSGQILPGEGERRMSSSMFAGKLGAVGDISATLKTVGAKVGAAPRVTRCGKVPPV